MPIFHNSDTTWGNHYCRGRGGAKHSLHMKNMTKIQNNKKDTKQTRRRRQHKHICVLCLRLLACVASCYLWSLILLVCFVTSSVFVLSPFVCCVSCSVFELFYNPCDHPCISFEYIYNQRWTANLVAAGGTRKASPRQNHEHEGIIVDTIRFLKYGFPRVRAYLLEDALISETCHLEESASHHLGHSLFRGRGRAKHSRRGGTHLWMGGNTWNKPEGIKKPWKKPQGIHQK